MQTHQYDVVIVGAGGAARRGAREASCPVRTAVISNRYPTRSHTGAAQGGMCAALANVEEDNWEWHTFDTVKGGDYLVDQDAAEIMAKEAIDAVLDLARLGLPFSRAPAGRGVAAAASAALRRTPPGSALGPPRVLAGPGRGHVPDPRSAGDTRPGVPGAGVPRR